MRRLGKKVGLSFATLALVVASCLVWSAPAQAGVGVNVIGSKSGYRHYPRYNYFVRPYVPRGYYGYPVVRYGFPRKIHHHHQRHHQPIKIQPFPLPGHRHGH
ncbi:hypothetical protein Pan216_26100 [Planctomycetes bacterium Pan216]|uniref:Uncharacterized protein n=1 Tax=Kolteria novifilia TaxID=2527975 RepID=A0A518B489_9BACT|nr:hypothetical protein Pan216_26100 [Planctomycetes bacterium Pan216]